MLLTIFSAILIVSALTIINHELLKSNRGLDCVLLPRRWSNHNHLASLELLVKSKRPQALNNLDKFSATYRQLYEFKKDVFDLFDNF